MEVGVVKGGLGGGGDGSVGECCSRFFLQLCLIVIVCATTSYGLFEDQIGKFDWRHQYLGKVRFASFDFKTGGVTPKVVFVSTEQNVIAAISLKSGEVLWRQVFEEVSPEDVYEAPLISVTSRNVISFSGGAEQYIRSWEKTKGSLLWERYFAEMTCNEKADLKTVGLNREVVLAIMCGRAFAIGTSTGASLWSIDLTGITGNKETTWLGSVYESESYSDVVSFVGGTQRGLQIISVDLAKGVVQKNNRVDSIPFTANRCMIVSNNVLCQDELTNQISEVDTNSLSITPIPASSGTLLQLAPSSPYFAVKLQQNLIVYAGKGKKVLEVPDDADLQFVSAAVANLVADEGSEPIYKVVVTYTSRDGAENHFRWFSLADGKEVADWSSTYREKISGTSAPFFRIFPLVFIKVDSSLTYRVLGVSEDDSLFLAQPSGKFSWNRPEGLSSILTVEMVDLPLSEAEANIEKEFEPTEGTIVNMLIQRLTTQAQQIQRALVQAGDEILGLAGLLRGTGWEAKLFGEKSLNSKAVKQKTSEKFERDYFNLHKVIVVATKSGKVFGLDNRSGGLLWEFWNPNLVPLQRAGGQGRVWDSVFLPLFVQRTTAHYPHPAQCVLLAKHKVSGNGVLVVFDPESGEVKERRQLSFPAGQAMLLPFTTDTEIHGLLVSSAKNPQDVIIYPSDAQLGEKETPLFLMRADSVSGELSGWKFQNTGLQSGKMVPAWKSTLPLAEGQSLIEIVPKKLTEKTHSLGKVLGDRSVLYKYSNPNLVAVLALTTTETSLSTSYSHSRGSISNSGGLLSIFLVDSVTGQVLFSAQHTRAMGPIHLVNCENWLVYSHWSEKTRRTELSVWEMFEGKNQNDPARFSSLNPSLVEPTVYRQSYVFPQGVTSLGVTHTERGMTNRHIMVAMPFGGILELPKSFLDPRRVLVPTMENREEGMIPYIPELPIATEHILNYNQTALRIRDIFSAPSGLESTSLVLAYGLDLYFTRMTPSGTFDILKDDFDHWFISLVLSALFLATVISKKFARHRDLKQAWK